ncbi:hypothetical protein A3K86_01635 [Photobacterium jeanii]|uniref:DUF4397 domain-containing protein n=1 Tax=Photobacterium jeanii TaxID=858640 RepID=A0A178KK51_9GAMM|nr:DUF4397 domain-containing protein [Photobacterium jeanii]OAN17650.1 hypothetical protein A3K86_01635 [Photobacterium jeanii]PST92693.1 DUF4397 domain-containing protein [Photobacterium jeanii]
MNTWLKAALLALTATFITACDDDDSSTPTNPELRVIHGSADAPAVDILVNDAAAFTDLKFKEVTDYASLEPATYNVKVVGAGTTTAVFEADLALEVDKKYSALALDKFDGGNGPFTVIVLDDTTPQMDAMAQIRLIHGSAFANTASAAGVDIYITAPQTDINTVEPNVTALVFKENTGFVALPAGQYDVSLTPTGSKNIVKMVTIDLVNGKVYNAIASDNDSTFTDVDLILMDGFTE